MELEKLKGIAAEVLQTDEKMLREDTSFADDLGADSLEIFQIFLRVEEEFDIEISSEEAESIVTLGDAAEAVRKALR